MAHTGNKDPKLSEVKAVLKRLQGLPTESETGVPRSAGARQRHGRGAALVTAMIIFVTAAGILGTTVFIGFMKQPAQDTPGAPPKKVAPNRPAPDPVAIRPALEAALDLMAKGRIRAARERLLRLAAGGTPHADVAWALARSYDPNFLKTVPAADAEPDIKEATRWYRAWYAAAVRQGLVADSVSLERIIGSMQQ